MDDDIDDDDWRRWQYQLRQRQNNRGFLAMSDYPRQPQIKPGYVTASAVEAGIVVYKKRWICLIWSAENKWALSDQLSEQDRPHLGRLSSLLIHTFDIFCSFHQGIWFIQ